MLPAPDLKDRRQAGHRLASPLVLLVLVAGPVHPYLHLALVPHRFCLAHQAFERRAADPDAGRPAAPRPDHPHDPDQHEPCLIANLTLLATRPATDLPQLTGAPLHARNAESPLFAVLPRSSRERLAKAPKTSPPTPPRS
jgi:hypothetical protein